VALDFLEVLEFHLYHLIHQALELLVVLDYPEVLEFHLFQPFHCYR
jgi:hypothetical protein